MFEGPKNPKTNRKSTLLLAQTECFVVFVYVYCLCFKKDKVEEELTVKIKTTQLSKMFEAFVIYLYGLKSQTLWTEPAYMLGEQDEQKEAVAFFYSVSH